MNLHPVDDDGQIRLDPHTDNWRAYAACAGLDPDLFFPPRGREAPIAHDACARCPVRNVCLTWALDENEKLGVWGGTSERERRHLRKTHTPPCGHWRRAHQGCDCRRCSAAWQAHVNANTDLRNYLQGSQHVR